MATSTSHGPGGQMTLVEHLAELRNRLIKCLLAVAFGMAVITVFYNPILDILKEPYCDSIDERECEFQQIEPTEGLSVRFTVTGYGGLAIAMPIVLWQLWRFVSPGLYDREKRYATPFVVSALTLFLLGAGLAYSTLPQALSFLNDIGGADIETNYRPGAYIRLVSYMMLAFGVGFEFPILLVFLQMARILDPETLRRGRRYAIVLICVLVAVITPSGDPISMLALSVPMVIFYEISIHIGSWFVRRQEARGIT
ncbi:MAG: twin-arginine translocase subunit TatC [Acidimicrobiales bacterium]